MSIDDARRLKDLCDTGGAVQRRIQNGAILYLGIPLGIGFVVIKPAVLWGPNVLNPYHTLG